MKITFASRMVIILERTGLQMVQKIISQRHLVTIREKVIEFDHITGDGGYVFSADDNYNVRFDSEHAESQKESYQMCLRNPDYSGPHMRIQTRTYMKNAIAVCECGKEIELWDQYLAASQCPYCGLWHNLFGQTLLDPEYWEMEDY